MSEINFQVRKDYIAGACVIARCIEDKVTVIRSTASGGDMVVDKFESSELNWAIGTHNRKLAGLPINRRAEQLAICECLYDLRKKLTRHEEIVQMYQDGLL